MNVGTYGSKLIKKLAQLQLKSKIKQICKKSKIDRGKDWTRNRVERRDYNKNDAK